MICDICKKRKAKKTITKFNLLTGKREVLRVCEVCFRKFSHSESFSPFSDLFSFDRDFFGDEFFSDFFKPEIERVDIDKLITDHTKELIQKSAEIAADFGRKEIETEHLLLAILEDPIVQQIIKNCKGNPEDLKNFIEYNALKNEGEKVEEVEISPRIKSVLEQAFYISQQMNQDYIGPEHILVALSQEKDSFASDVLLKFGLTPEKLKKAIKSAVEIAKKEKKGVFSPTPNLDKFSRDLTSLAKEGKLDPVIGRFDEIETVIEVLLRRTKNNPVLVGEAGVGKTAIVEGLAQKIVKGEVPDALKQKRIVELNVNSLIAGTKYRGEFEERIKKVIDEILKNKDTLIVFVDEIHTIVGAGSAEGGMDLSNTIKPHLARGEIRLIGATTLTEYRKYIEKDPALERRFQPVLVDEPTVNQTIEILFGLRDRYEAHHKVKISDEAIVAAVELSSKYIPSRHLPDKAIDVLDQAASRVALLSFSLPKEIKKKEKILKKLKSELSFARSHKQKEKVKELEKEIKEIESDLEKIKEKWRKEKISTTPEVKREHIAMVISKLTGVPITELTKEERERYAKLGERLKERVIGQDRAVESVVNAVKVARAGLREKQKPIAVFLFLGPTGVGKTELAKSLAWAIFGDESALIRIDMSEYMEKHSVARLIGSPPGYVGYEEGGQLTEAVRTKPYSIVLFDEIEKAHPEVFNILLQVFDDGRLTDGKGRTVDFTNTVIIATSNIGSDIILKSLKEKKKISDIEPEIKKILYHHFRPEFLNRIDEIIIFNPLDKKGIEAIVKLQLERVKELAKGQGIEITKITKDVIEFLRDKGFSEEFGAREIKRIIYKEIEIPLSREILEGKIVPPCKIKISLKKGKIKFEKVK